MKNMWRGLLIIALLSAAFLITNIALAHANLVRSEPPPNSVLDAAPAEIRMWFSEPLEEQFSKINLRDKNGNIVNTPATQIDPNDPTQMFMVPGKLPDGLYTIVWRSLSAADGHPSLGSYPLVIGDASLLQGTSDQVDDIIRPDSTFIRWSNLISLALTMGGIGFLLFVWTPAAPKPTPTIERRILTLIWIGWILIGITGFLLLVLQYSLATGNPLLTGVDGDSLNSVVADTRFGHLWLSRTAVWAGLGGALWFAQTDRWFYLVSLALGGIILAINSAFSHANGAYDLTASVASDWLHLAATALWVGGLVHFISIIGPVRNAFKPAAPLLGNVVARFSNFARVSVATLFITGLYAAWLQVGSIDALLNTPYGQALLIKLILIVPVIGLAFINLVYTHRGFESGDEKWGVRLRGLLGVEIVLTVGILLAVGVMTSISPARVTLAERAANPPAPAPQPIKDVSTVNGLLVQFDVTPGWIGENTFTLKLVDSSGAPINDVTLIRMRFESQTQNIGESELRPERVADGVYRIAGANLSATGEWRIRVTIQRPNQFDTLVDFTPTVPAAPTSQAPVPLPDPGTPMPNRVLVLLLVGIAALAVGGYFLGENRARLLQASSLLAVGLLVIGGTFLFSAIQSVSTTKAMDSAFAPAPQAPVRMAVNSNQALPYLVTADGHILRPDTDGGWKPLALDAHVNDIYVDMQKVIWAATDKGFYADENGNWRQISAKPANRIVLTHGFMFALGKDHITRIPAGGIEQDYTRELDLPQPHTSADDFVMLGNHTHILESDGQLFHSFDLGLGWKPVSTTGKIDAISPDANGNLLATTADSVMVWDASSETWSKALHLPGGDPHPTFAVFNEQVYAVGSGMLYQLKNDQWQAITIPDAADAYLITLAYQYPRSLWVLDAAGSRLWSTDDGSNWLKVDVKAE